MTGVIVSGIPCLQGYDDSKPDAELLNRGRMYCGFDDKLLEERSIERYRFCLNYIRQGDSVLDAACGSGYGSYILSQKSSIVTGVDVSEHAISYAREHFRGIEYQQVDLTRPLDFTDREFDAVVSIETIEHITEHNTFLSELRRILKPGGVLILTTVDREVYTCLGRISNPFHIGELAKWELLALVSKYFKVEEVHGQVRYQPLSTSRGIAKRVYQSALTVAGRLDVFGWRYYVASRLNRQIDTFSQSLSSMVDSGIERCELDIPGKHYQVIIVARRSI